MKYLVFVIIISLSVMIVGCEKKKRVAKCPTCKPCECKEKLTENPVRKAEETLKQLVAKSKAIRLRLSKKPPKDTIRSSILAGDSWMLYLHWLYECKAKDKAKGSSKYRSIISCIRWNMVFSSYLQAKLSDGKMLWRRQIAFRIYNILGESLCEKKKKASKAMRSFIAQELHQLYSNMRENTRQLKIMKQRFPSLKIPKNKICYYQPQKGQHVWGY